MSPLSEIEREALLLFKLGQYNGHINRVVLDVMRRMLLDEDDLESLSGSDHWEPVKKILDMDKALKEVIR